jgi:hypothetical protein
MIFKKKGRISSVVLSAGIAIGLGSIFFFCINNYVSYKMWDGYGGSQMDWVWPAMIAGIPVVTLAVFLCLRGFEVALKRRNSTNRSRGQY